MTTIDDFYEFERQYSLFDITIHDVPVWERVRFSTWREIQEQTETAPAHPSLDFAALDYLRGGIVWFRNLFRRNPFLAPDRQFLFIGHQRRKLEPDGYWWDLYCDPIHEGCDLDSVHFEHNHQFEHATPAKTDSIRYLDLLTYTGTLQRKLGLHGFSLRNDDRCQLSEIETALEERFGVELSLVDSIVHTMATRACRLWLYDRLLSVVDPCVVVLVVSYGKETLIEACKQRGIPVVELQHGNIHPDHLGYAFSGYRTKRTFPDYLFTWGEFWTDRAAFPIPQDRVLPIGYPYLERRINRYECERPDDQIVFISQGTIGVELSKLAVRLSENLSVDADLVYKLHPGEYDRWRDAYPWLEGRDVRIVDSDEPPLYELFANSTIQVGVGSTAVFEGLAFDLETYVYDAPGFDTLLPLVEENAAELVTSAEDLASRLDDQDHRFDRERYFAPDAAERICAALRDVRDGTPPSQ